MKIVYIAHPIGNDVKANLEKIRKIVRHINLTMPEIIPFVPYYADCVSMDDSIKEERERGIRNDMEFFKRKCFDELWLYGDCISNGMKAEIELAYDCGIGIIPKTVETLAGANIILKKYVLGI